MIKIIIGIRFNKIEGENKKVEDAKEISVSSTPTIKNAEKKEIDIFGENIIGIEFEFVTKYEPNIGYIKIDGEILAKYDNIEEILKEWKKKKSLPEEVSIQLMNAIFRRCLTKIISISEDLQLPPPIILPTVTKRK